MFVPGYDVIVDLHESVLDATGGLQGIKTDSDIHGAAGRPFTYTMYVDDYDIDTVCALLIDSIARNHGFNDGNKRTALMTAVITYRVNGVHFKPTMTMNRAFDACVMWVVKKKPEIPEIEVRLKKIRNKHEIGKEPSTLDLLLSFIKMRRIKEQQLTQKKQGLE